MYEIPWSKPVNVKMLDGKCRTVVGPLDAMKCLQSEWPVRDGAYYGCAIRACDAALKRKKKPDDARSAFISASREAFLTIQTNGMENGGYRRSGSVSAGYDPDFTKREM